MLKKIRNVVCCVICSSLSTLATDALAIETGLASYYSDKFQGRKTASGARYDRNKLTAAHRTLPIGSQITVTNLKNKNSVIVTINDRGPYNNHRKLDLSYAAAKELGLVAMGVAPVSYALVTPNNKDNDFKNDFEQIIPREYTPGVLEVAKSEEELIEAEEEMVDTKESETPPIAEAEISEAKAATPPHSPHKHKSAKISAEKNVHPDKPKKHAVAQAEKSAKIKTVSKSHESKAKNAKAKTEFPSKKSTHKS